MQPQNKRLPQSRPCTALREAFVPALHGCRIESGMTSVIAGSTRNPCTDDLRVSGAAWIAGQARNDNVEV